MTITKNVLLGLLFLVFFVANTKAQTADEIIESYFENTGGLDNLKNSKAKKYK